MGKDPITLEHEPECEKYYCEEKHCALQSAESFKLNLQSMNFVLIGKKLRFRTTDAHPELKSWNQQTGTAKTSTMDHQFLDVANYVEKLWRLDRELLESTDIKEEELEIILL